MSSLFPDDVKNILLPILTSMDLRVESHLEGTAFGDSLVVLSGPKLRLRVARDRGRVFLDLGSSADPQTWFDAATVAEYLGLTELQPFGGHDTVGMLMGIGNFVVALAGELEPLFGNERYPFTKKELSRLAEVRAERRFGSPDLC